MARSTLNLPSAEVPFITLDSPVSDDCELRDPWDQIETGPEVGMQPELHLSGIISSSENLGGRFQYIVLTTSKSLVIDTYCAISPSQRPGCFTSLYLISSLEIFGMELEVLTSYSLSLPRMLQLAACLGLLIKYSFCCPQLLCCSRLVQGRPFWCYLLS